MSIEQTDRQPEHEKEYEKKRLYNMPETNVHEDVEPNPVDESDEMDEDTDDDERSNLTKEEIKKLCTEIFWELSKKKDRLLGGDGKREGPMFWQDGKKEAMFCEQIGDELKRAVNKTRRSEVAMDYEKQLEQMRKNPDGYSAEAKQQVVDQAFVELVSACPGLTKDEKAIHASRNVRSRRKYFR